MSADDELDVDRLAQTSTFRKRVVELVPEQVLPSNAAVWDDAIVFLTEGEIELEFRGGARQHFGRGAVLCLAPLPPGVVRNVGAVPARLIAISRHLPEPRPAVSSRTSPRHTKDDSLRGKRRLFVMSDLSGKTSIVVGASRGLGRGITTAFVEAGARVVAVARTASAFAELTNGAATIQPEVADAGDATVPGSLLDRYEPEVVILVAGATPLMRPLQHQTWETFSVNWHTDVRIAFHWLREALLKPLRPGSRVVVFSSGAALAGSPLSGGYAGAKATQRFITGYAQDEAERAGLGITFTAVLPRITPLTDLGRPAVRAYAARSGQSEEEYLQEMGEPLTPDVAGAALVELVRADAATVAPGYLLTGAGLQTLP
jgi:NAD(P)-dependent dehydrogenase (short-subunit alcohol dehydrogenase family)